MPGVPRDRRQAGRPGRDGDPGHRQRPVRGAARAEQGAGGCRAGAGSGVPAAGDPIASSRCGTSRTGPCPSPARSTTSGPDPAKYRPSAVGRERIWTDTASGKLARPATRMGQLSRSSPPRRRARGHPAVPDGPLGAPPHRDRRAPGRPRHRPGRAQAEHALACEKCIVIYLTFCFCTPYLWTVLPGGRSAAPQGLAPGWAARHHRSPPLGQPQDGPALSPFPDSRHDPETALPALSGSLASLQ